MVVRDSICAAYCFGASDRVAQGYPFSLLSCLTGATPLVIYIVSFGSDFCEWRLELGGALIISPFEVFYNVYISCSNSSQIAYGV